MIRAVFDYAFPPAVERFRADAFGYQPPMARRERGRDDLAVPVLAGGGGFGPPDGVQDSQVVGVGQVALQDRGDRQLGPVAAEDVG